MSRCSIDGCIRQASKREMCDRHYRRILRTGHINLVKGEWGEPLDYFLTHVHDEGCPKWPFATTSRGYGLATINGFQYGVHVLACMLKHGESPKPGMVAAHECGNGHLGCFGSRCMTWKTISENHKDKVRHGTVIRGERMHSSKLTEIKVREIRNLLGTMKDAKLARSFGVSPSTLWAVKHGKTWGWLK